MLNRDFTISEAKSFKERASLSVFAFLMAPNMYMCI